MTPPANALLGARSCVELAPHVRRAEPNHAPTMRSPNWSS